MDRYFIKDYTRVGKPQEHSKSDVLVDILPCIYCIINGETTHSRWQITGKSHKSYACGYHGDIIKKKTDLDMVYLST